METVLHDFVLLEYGSIKTDQYVLVPLGLAIRHGGRYYEAVRKGTMTVIVGMCPATHVWTPFNGDGDRLMAEASQGRALGLGELLSTDRESSC